MTTKSAIHGIFDDVASSHKLIAELTVYTDHMLDSGNLYITRYWGRNKEAVELYAKDRKEATDTYRSPSLSNGGIARKLDDVNWYVDLKEYGLD